MPKIKSGERLIVDSLQAKACTKQAIFRSTREIFSQFKGRLGALQAHLSGIFERIDKSVEITFRDVGEFETEIKFGGDILYFSMHTNVFTFDKKHRLFRSKYVREDPLRAYFGMITVYNFLADSIKYNRSNDLGILIARIFINRDRHFFVDGEKSLSVRYNDLEKSVLNETCINDIIESNILFTLDFDLFVPPYDQMRAMSVLERMQANQALQTAKPLGFRLGH